MQERWGAIKQKLAGVDLWLLVLTVALVLIGLSTLQSIQLAGGGVEGNFVQRQVFAVLLGIGSLVFLTTFDYRYFGYVFPLFYLLGIGLLLVVLVGGTAVRGSTRWFEVGGYQFQPSEVVKFLSIVFYAFFLKWALHRWNEVVVLGLSLLLLIPILILVFFEPDLSTMGILFIIWLGLVFVGFKDLKLLVLLLFLAGLLLPFLYFFISPYQQQRLVSFLDPGSDPLGSGYHSIQSTIAVGSGKIWGRHWGKGTQSHLRFLPDQHTDFIFATFCEEQGFVGAMVLLLLYSLFFWRLLKALQEVDDYVGRVIIGGILALFFSQFAINVGMNLGLLPIAGVPLPLVSYGGTAVLINLAMVGLVESVIKHQV